MGEEVAVAKKASDVMQPALDRLDDEYAQIVRDDTFAQRRENEQYTPEDPHSANLDEGLANWEMLDDPEVMNHYGERALMRGHEDEDPEAIEKKKASHEINNHYMIRDEEDFKAVKDKMLPEDTKVDLSSPDARLRTLDNLTQNRPDMKDGENTCVASSLLAGAIASGGKTGTEGVTELLDAVAAQTGDPDTLKTFEANLGNVREKIAKGEPLTIADMHTMQNVIHTQFNMKEQQANPTGDQSGVNNTTLQDFMNKSPSLQKRFQDNGLAVSYINNSADNDGGHAVLAMAREGRDPAIYDPYMRDGGQVITDDEMAAEYEAARRRTKDGKAPMTQ